MKQALYISLVFFTGAIVCGGCKKEYSPPAIKVDNKFLVIDGSLVNGVDSPTVIFLSRTVKLTDSTSASIAETGAKVSVEEMAGSSFDLTENAGGKYISNPLLLNTTGRYRLKIITSGGNQYLSDFVEVKQTPAIDSITWQQQDNVMIYADTHDPLNKTQQAYQYYQILKKNTEDLGSLFDAQPTQLTGNIHSVADPSEVVIGYFTASSVQQKRIFINNIDLADWVPVDAGRDCDIISIPQDTNNYLTYNYPDAKFEPYYFQSMSDLIILTRSECVDCRIRGGTTTTPAFL